MNIFTLSEKALEEKHKRFMDSDFDFDRMIHFIRGQCDSFPDGSAAHPDIFQRGRAKQKEKFLEAVIKVRQSTLGHGGHAGSKRRSFTGGVITVKRNSNKWITAHRRIIKGTLHEMAEEALATIVAAKRIAEILTVLEEGLCHSEENTSS